MIDLSWKQLSSDTNRKQILKNITVKIVHIPQTVPHIPLGKILPSSKDMTHCEFFQVAVDR